MSDNVLCYLVNKVPFVIPDWMISVNFSRCRCRIQSVSISEEGTSRGAIVFKLYRSA